MLKAIETKYKGYRFRSRAEARWAVALDNAGIKWFYEKEGYDLDGEWYLPDFYLPDYGFLEIKGVLDAPRIYFAGKIYQDDWRPASAEVGVEDYLQAYLAPILETGFFYNGPFVIRCDHGCYHGECSHGASENGCCDGGPSRKHIPPRCFHGIQTADYVFTWIDSLDCYGTLIECGYAIAKKVPLVVGVDDKLRQQIDYRLRPVWDRSDLGEMFNDLWFLQVSSKSFGYFTSASQAFESYFPSIRDFRLCEKLAQASKEKVYLATSLDEDKYNAYWYRFRPRNFQHLDIYPFFPFVNDDSIAAGRSARFEHGENGL